MLTSLILPAGARVTSTDAKGNPLGLTFDTVEHALATVPPRRNLRFSVCGAGVEVVSADGIVNRILWHDEDEATARAAVAAWKAAREA